MAKHICHKCQVRAECFEYGKHERVGIWGGIYLNKSRVQRAEQESAGDSEVVVALAISCAVGGAGPPIDHLGGDPRTESDCT